LAEEPKPVNDSKTGQPRADRNTDRPPQSGQHSSWRAFWKILTSFDRTKLLPYMAFRNAVGMLLSLALGTATQIAFGAPAAACGALFVSYSDGSDPYRHRATRMIAASFTLAFAAFVGATSEQYRFGDVEIGDRDSSQGTGKPGVYRFVRWITTDKALVGSCEATNIPAAVAEKGRNPGFRPYEITKWLRGAAMYRRGPHPSVPL
jgi:hypothetical protein